MTDETSRLAQLASTDSDIEPARAPIGTARWDESVLPALLAFAVFAVLLLNYSPSFPRIATATAAVAVDPQRPDYAMTITAKRLPLECRGNLQGSVAATCASFLAGDAVIEMHETDNEH